MCIKEQHYKVNFISVFWIGIGICQFYMNVLQIMSTPNRKNHNEIIFFQFHEVLEIKTGHTSLHITLTGKGVSPMIQINMPMQDGVLDMGAVLAGEYLERTFKVRNINKGFLYEEGL